MAKFAHPDFSVYGFGVGPSMAVWVGSGKVLHLAALRCLNLA